MVQDVQQARQAIPGDLDTDADEDEGDLRTLADDIGRAIERFQVLQLRRIREHQLVSV